MLLLKVFCITSVLFTASGKYQPNWDSLDSRPLPPWYDEAKIGIFIHWGVFSVPSFGSEWFWKHWKDLSWKYVAFMIANYRPGFTYQDFGPEFTAEFYEPDDWAKLFSASGAKYIVLTSKHHEGFTLWPSKYSWGWNSMDVGPHRDLLGELAESVRLHAPDVHFGLYHSLLEWFNPLYMQDKANSYQTNQFVTEKTMPELYELVNQYKPDVIWSDGEWEALDTYWKSTEFLAWLFNDSPVKDTVVVNDRWGSNCMCVHGSFYTCQDGFNPGKLQNHKWENCRTLDRSSWGYNRKSNSLNYLTIHELLTILAETISCGGNLLVNVGPTHEGIIPPIMEERLRQMGEWLTINGEAIYKSKPWIYQNDTYSSNVWYTQSTNGSIAYALVLDWPLESSLVLGNVASSRKTSINLLGYSNNLKFQMTDEGTKVFFPSLSSVGSKWVFVLKMTNVLPHDDIHLNTIN